MQPQYHFNPAHCHPSIPMIDMEFDRFEVNNDLEIQLREADTATFYHNACNPEE